MTSVLVTTNTVTVDVTNGSETVIVQTPAPLGLPVGGTTNQVLTKTSSTDFDTTWTPVPTAAEFSALQARVQQLENLDILLLNGY